MDGGCEQSIVTESAFLILSKSGTFYDVFGALEGKLSSALEVVNAATLVTLATGVQHILVVNQALLDENDSQHESLLQPHQVWSHGVVVDDCAKRHHLIDGSYGKQCIRVKDIILPLYFDGWKMFLAISKPTETDLAKCPIIELTSPLPYEPMKQLHTHRRKKQNSAVILKEWQVHLGYPPEEVVQHTIAATTQMVQTVEAETRTYMRDHLKARLLPLHPHQINDTCFTNTFFSHITSVRGFTMFQMFSF